jgi:type VI protein secretion system component Hcp
MLLMRIKEIDGDCKIPGYEKWIMLESFSFGAERKMESAKQGGGRDIDTGKGDSQEFTVSKPGDVATVYLMYAAIKHRASGQAAVPFTVDIAFVELRGYGDQQVKGETKAFLKIRFGKALIKNWTFNGDAEKSPNESITFWYNQVAMSYDSATDDGKGYQTHGPRGWDQLEGKDWTPSGW